MFEDIFHFITNSKLTDSIAMVTAGLVVSRSLGAIFSKTFKVSLMRELAKLSLAAMSATYSVKNKTPTRVPTESAIIATNRLTSFITCAIILLALTLAGYLSDSGLIHDVRAYSLSLLLIVLSFRAALMFRVSRGLYGLNEEEAIEFYNWLKTKSENGGSDFGGKAVEDIKEEFLKDLGIQTGSTSGAYS